MELAAALHHSAFRGAGPVTYDALRSHKTVNSKEGTEFFAMSEDCDVVGGGRPPSLVDVRPQERVQQRTVEQIVDPVPLVPLLHDGVPQMVEQLVDILAPLDFRVAVQVIEVPNIVCPPRAARTVLRAPQTAEQLVEVPTPVSYSSLLQRTVEQHVDIPVPLGRGGRNAHLQGFLPGQVSTALQERLSEQIAEQIVDIPGGSLQDFRPGQSSSSSSHFPAGILEDADELGEGVFRTFPQNKKVRNWVRTRVRECTPVPAHPRQLLSALVSTPGS